LPKKKLYIIQNRKAWIPAPSTLLRTGFAGMTESGNRQSINRIGIISVLFLFLSVGDRGMPTHSNRSKSTENPG